MGTFLVAAILAAVVTLIVWGMVKDKKQGKSCGGCAGCSGCSSGCGEHGACGGLGGPDPGRQLKEFRMR